MAEVLGPDFADIPGVLTLPDKVLLPGDRIDRVAALANNQLR